VPVDVVIGVEDPVCPWNTGCWRLTGDPESAQCRRVDGDPDLEVAIDDLGAVYLGGRSLSRLAAAGRVHEHRPGSLTTASLAFAWDPAPWCQEIF
jgi:predicted acetyltransferase